MHHPPAADDLGGRSVSLALSVPVDALILLIGIAASGKSTFARRHFAPTEIISSDAMRAMITDDPTAQGPGHSEMSRRNKASGAMTEATVAGTGSHNRSRVIRCRLPLRDDLSIGRPAQVAQGHLSPTLRRSGEPVHRPSTN